jgi:hypothetical protein
VRRTNCGEIILSRLLPINSKHQHGTRRHCACSAEQDDARDDGRRHATAVAGAHEREFLTREGQKAPAHGVKNRNAARLSSAKWAFLLRCSEQ